MLAIAALWLLICAIGALGSYLDNLERAAGASYPILLWKWWRSHLLMTVFSCALYAGFAAWPAAATRVRPVFAVYLLCILVLLPIELLYVGMLEMLDGRASTVWGGALTLSRFSWFLEFAWMTFTYVTIVGVRSWAEGRSRERALLQAHADKLALQLELEEQRLLALRAQLEPHFIFNALNAISALVRGDDRRVALTGIGHLSDLLRYALQASERDAVSVAEERQFIAGYLALQKMRYGERLQVSIAGDDDAVLSGEIPPLLLQPLVENALRHDLDCHDGQSDIRLVFAREGERLRIRICNPALAARAPNPGLGMGLRHSRARLQLAYGGQASLSTSVEEGRFVVDIAVPRYAQA